jgi:hypothetical protein
MNRHGRLTTEYTVQYITDPKNQSFRKIYLFDLQVVYQFSFAFILIYLVSIVPIFERRLSRAL